MRMLPSSLLISLLVVEVEAKSLNEAMAKIKKDAGFDPKEPPEHKTDITGLGCTSSTCWM
jgi:hypothetical protein